MTYNILQGGRRGAPLDEVVRAVAPDVLLVNEAPKTPFVWRGQCRRLAERWGMRYVGGGREAGSNMVLVSGAVEVTSAHAEVIPQPLFQPRRGIEFARLRVEGRPLGVVSCHLSLDRDRRQVEVERVLEVADGLGDRVVVAGDLNERPDGPCWRRLEAAGFVDHGSRSWLTFPSEAPDRRIDAVLVRGDFAVVRQGDPGIPSDLLARASDHRPVLAEIELAS
ncbi:MAG: endonuclease/exonuclease/phosphatase family protein [Mycobacteriaceae bacterium]